MARPAATLVVVPNVAPSATLASAKVATNAKVITILECPRLEFAANSYKLLPNSEQALLTCAVPVLRQNSALFVGVKGSAAWPGPKGAVSRDQVEAAAKARAQAVINFLASQGIAQNRFVLQWTLPPPDHRETNDLILQAQDRYIEISLLSSGL